MNAKRASDLLLRISKAATNHAQDPLTRLDSVMNVIREQQCQCGRWQRGGKRRGSALCEQCFKGE